MRLTGRGRLRFAVAIVCTVALGLSCARQPTSLPNKIRIPIGERATLPITTPLPAAAISSDETVVRVPFSSSQRRLRGVEVQPREIGDAMIHTRIFGVIPWTEMAVQVVPQHQVIVCGQSIGVSLHARGVIVVGFQQVGGVGSPAAKARIQVGDVIEKVNGRPVHNSAQLQARVAAAGDQVEVSVRRGKTVRNVTVSPWKDGSDRVHLGLYVRDHAVGVGTLTFVEPFQHRFGALGHVVTDVDTGLPMDGDGKIYLADVIAVVKGMAGRPGEKRGRFTAGTSQLGEIDDNTPYGVFGHIETAWNHGWQPKWLPVATPEQVHEGSATLLTVLHGTTVEAFAVHIESLKSQDAPATKSLVLKVTDARLLRETGGIVQGMSGSPLVQDGRLIGAVTHVFVSDPTHGYGVYAAWMIKECSHENDTDEEEISTAMSNAAERN